MRGTLFAALLEDCADFAMVPLLTEGGVRHRARQRGRQPGAVRDAAPERRWKCHTLAEDAARSGESRVYLRASRL
jgi:hypothetical protein